jgi:hypothetical protein
MEKISRIAGNNYKLHKKNHMFVGTRHLYRGTRGNIIDGKGQKSQICWEKRRYKR